MTPNGLAKLCAVIGAALLLIWYLGWGVYRGADVILVFPAAWLSGALWERIWP